MMAFILAESKYPPQCDYPCVVWNLPRTPIINANNLPSKLILVLVIASTVTLCWGQHVTSG